MTDKDAPAPLSANEALFLDFDGTLAPLAARPQDVVLPPWVLPALQQLNQLLDGALAVVSGRPLDGIDRMLAPLHLSAAGIHGAQCRLPGGAVLSHEAPTPPALRAVADALVARHPDLWVEPKPVGFSLHYRARPELGEHCHALLQQAVAQHPGWELMRGHCVAEVKAAAHSKATALVTFMGTARFHGRLPVFLGDDVTDEDGMRAAQAVGGRAVKVGRGPSVARWRLADPHAVGLWLQHSITHLQGGSTAA